MKVIGTKSNVCWIDFILMVFAATMVIACTAAMMPPMMMAVMIIPCAVPIGLAVYNGWQALAVPNDVVLFDENTMELVINETKNKSVRVRLDDIVNASWRGSFRRNGWIGAGIVFTLKNGEIVHAHCLSNCRRVLDTVMRLRINKYDSGDDYDYDDDFYL